MNEKSSVRRPPAPPPQFTPQAPIDELPMVEEAFVPPPPTQAVAQGEKIDIHSVVQVINPASQYYGVLFQIGDIQNGQAHGFHMIAGGRREHVTVRIEEIFMIGISKTRSKNPVSPQWEMEHKKV